MRELVAMFARIGCLSFGGPAVQIGMLHRGVVEEKRWLSEERFLHALNYCMLLPGPEAQQLATYIGWLMHGVRGGVVAGLLFVIPGLLVIIGLSTIYVLYQDVTWLSGVFFGLKAAVLAIVLEAVVKLGRRILDSRFRLMVAASAFVALHAFGLPFPLVVALAALAGFLMMRRSGGSLALADDANGISGAPARPPVRRSVLHLLLWIGLWQSPLVLLWLADGSGALAAMFAFFSKLAMVTFGGAYAALTYVAQVAVEDYAWLRPAEMMDGLALAETTPGPLVLVLSFVGFLVGFHDAATPYPLAGGILGAAIAAWATFVPSFIWIFVGAPFIERLRASPVLSASLSAVGAAVVGVILNLAVWFGLHVLFREVRVVEIVEPLGLKLSIPTLHSADPIAFLIFGLSAFLLLRLKWGLMPVLVLSAAAGLLLRLW